MMKKMLTEKYNLWNIISKVILNTDFVRLRNSSLEFICTKISNGKKSIGWAVINPYLMIPYLTSMTSSPWRNIPAYFALIPSLFVIRFLSIVIFNVTIFVFDHSWEVSVNTEVWVKFQCESSISLSRIYKPKESSILISWTRYLVITKENSMNKKGDTLPSRKRVELETVEWIEDWARIGKIRRGVAGGLSQLVLRSTLCRPTQRTSAN